MALFRSIATVGGWTMMSRLLGFGRDILIANSLGTGMVADAFFVAFGFPNLFRRIFAEGAFNSAFVPLFARRLHEQGQAAALRFAEEALALMLATLLGLTMLAQLLMPWLMYVIAPGFADDADKFDLTILFTQIAFPYLLFISLTALQGGVLNSLHRFAHAAAAPLLLNIVAILALAVVAPAVGMPGHVLVWAVAAAGIAQFLWLVLACHRAGVTLWLRLPRLSPGMRTLLRLMGPGVLGAGVIQINLQIGRMIASLQDEAVSFLYYADRIYQLPLGVIGVAVGVVLLPELTRHLRAARPGDAIATLNRCIELALLLTLPATAALIAIPEVIVGVLYERGAFDAAATRSTALALAVFAAGLPAYVLIKALAPVFYAREDTMTPFRFAAVSVAVNIVLSLAFYFLIGFVGIAVATAVAAWSNTGLLAWKLRREGHFAIDARLRTRLPRLILCSAAMGLGVWLAALALSSLLAGGLAAKVVALAAIVIGGALLFGGLIVASRAVTPADLRAALRRG